MSAGAQLARVGNNLNQVASVLNSGGRAEYTDDAVARLLRAAARVEAAAIEMARRWHRGPGHRHRQPHVRLPASIAEMPCVNANGNSRTRRDGTHSVVQPA
ncbi:plasmid mobilization relaxosome protein MobC [Streptomyces colonosanans]|uniref:plasmid mobilization relaxosome protein MobC n=1 Tax=Streptomyces colonosanans TaxID=1428652 RepID=UPI000A52FE56|nr:plasmid mobilization relaxosome protein MobC [Streptomyces colonosanans]